MSTAELQNKIIKQVVNINDDHLLEELLHLIEIESSDETFFEIPEEHIESIKLGLKQIEEGKVQLNEVVQSKMKACLTK